jgi:HAD superfamily hydrolase (TIGR01490 family)
VAPDLIAGEAAAAAARVESDATPVPDPTAAAFFDIDNTIVRGASVFHLAMGLAKRDFFALRDVRRFFLRQAKFRLFGGEDLDDMSNATEAALVFVTGHTVEEIVGLGQEIFDERIERKLYAGTIALAQQHLAKGQRVWLVSAAPVEIATIIADNLGLTGALGTVAETIPGPDGDVYTGRLVGRPLHGAAKAEAVRALADREGLDLSRCAAYSDSSNDVPMLSLVGQAFAINPDAALRRHARDMCWPVFDYRTGRKAARLGVPTAAVFGLSAGAGVAYAGIRRRRHR